MQVASDVGDRSFSPLEPGMLMAHFYIRSMHSMHSCH
jgi:hypothetical protein